MGSGAPGFPAPLSSARDEARPAASASQSPSRPRDALDGLAGPAAFGPESLVREDLKLRTTTARKGTRGAGGAIERARSGTEDGGFDGGPVRPTPPSFGLLERSGRRDAPRYNRGAHSNGSSQSWIECPGSHDDAIWNSRNREQAPSRSEVRDRWTDIEDDDPGRDGPGTTRGHPGKQPGDSQGKQETEGRDDARDEFERSPDHTEVSRSHRVRSRRHAVSPSHILGDRA